MTDAAAPPRASEPVAWRFKNTIDSEWMVSFSHPVDRWNIIEPLYAAPLPSAGRPVTPCTREEAATIAKSVNLRMSLVGVWKNSNSLGGLTTDDLMRFADAARGVK